MLPVWISHYNDIERLHRAWQTVFEKRAVGGAIALSGFHYQFLVVLYDTLRAWLSLQPFERNGPKILTECLSDILDKSSRDIILVTQVKRTRRSDSFKDALTELWLIYDLAMRTTPHLAAYLRFRILSKKAELQDFKSVLNRWKPDEKYSLETDPKDFLRKVSVELFSNPEDEVLSLLVKEFHASEPIGYMQRWLGNLLEAASQEGATGFEYAARTIWNDLQSLDNSSLIAPPSIYVWTSQDKSPDNIVKGEVLTGERPQAHHLRQGFFAPRPEVYQPIADKAQQWISDLSDYQDKQLRLPVFWIGGRSGSGKSVALMHVLSLLYESGIGSIFWLGNKTELLRQAIPWALKLRDKNQQVIIGIDDPYAPNTQNDDIIWKEALAVLESVRQDGDASALPLIICCGPTEQAERMQRDLPEDVNVNVQELEFFEPNQKDIVELRNWYIQRTKKSPPKVADENVLLVQLFFEWETGQSLPEFASRFRNRIKESDQQGILENLITRMLCVNRLYVGYPAAAIGKYLTPDLQDTFQRLREDNHIAQTSNEYGIGLWLAHAHLSNVIYENWYPLNNSQAVRTNHLRQVIDDGFEFGSSASEKMAPLWAISNATFGSSEQSPLVGRLEQETILNLLPSVYASRTQKQNEPITLSELPVWIQLQAFFPKTVLAPEPVNEALNLIKVENLEEKGLRLACHKLLQHYNSFSEFQRSKIIEAIIQLLTQSPNWYAWAPIAEHAYRRTKKPELLNLIIKWVTDNPRFKGAERLFILVFNNNSTDSMVLNAARDLLPRVGGELGWGDVAIKFIEETGTDIPTPVLRWAKNNYRQFGACFLLGHFINRRIDGATEWALNWCERWHTERSANYVLEPLLDLVGANKNLRDWCLNWVAMNYLVIDSSYIVQKLVKTFPLDPEVLSMGFQWLESNDPEHGSWQYVWRALYDANSFVILSGLDSRTSEAVDSQLAVDATSLSAHQKLADPIIINPKTWYFIALGFERAACYEDAVAALKKAVELKPDFTQAWQMLGAVYNQLEKYETGLQTSLKLTELSPNDPEAWYYLAITLGKVERYEDEIAALKKAVELKPDFTQAWQMLGAVYNQLEKHETGLQTNLKLTELSPNDPEAWYYLSIAYSKVGNEEDRIIALEKATELKPDFTEAWQALGTVYNQLGRYELAHKANLKLLEANLKLVELSPNDPEAWYYLAITFGRLEREEEEIEPLKKTIELKPDFTEAWQALGAVYYQLGEYELALEANLKLIELSPNDPEAWYYLAFAFSKLERKEDEIEPLKKAIELKPDFTEAWQALGAVYNLLGRHELALEANLKLTELSPSDPEAWYYLAITFSKLNRKEDDIAAMIKVTELKPDSVKAWQALSGIYKKLKRPELMLQANLKLTELKPDDSEVWYRLSMSYFNLRRFKESAAALKKAIQLKPDVTVAQEKLSDLLALIESLENEPFEPEKLSPNESREFYSLGRSHIESGNLAEAVSALHKAIEVSADKMETASVILRTLNFEAIESFHNRLYERATILLQISISINPNLSYVWKFLSSSYRRIGNDQEALDAAKHMIDLAPESAEAWYKLGKRYAAVGQINDAVGAFNKALKLNENFKSARRELQKALKAGAVMNFEDQQNPSTN